MAAIQLLPGPGKRQRGEQRVKYLYCLTSLLASVDALPPGLGGRQVQQVSCHSLSALVSDIDTAHLVGNASNALVHHAVVQAALQRSAAVMPCRFGTLLADEEQLLTLFRTHYAVLAAELARLRDKLEVGVQAIFSGSTAETEPALGAEGLTPGTRYLLVKKRHSEARRAVCDQAERCAQALNAATTPWWAEVQAQQRHLDQGLLLSLCYLVPRHQVAAFRHTYEQFRSRSPQLKLLYTGPWPPYSFTAIDLRPGER